MTKEGSGVYVEPAAAARPVLGGHTLLYSPIECLRLGVCASLVWQTSQLKVAFIFVRGRRRRYSCTGTVLYLIYHGSQDRRFRERLG